MKKKREVLPVVLWALMATGIRALYFFLSNGQMNDTCEYYAHAMIKLGQKEPVLTSELAYIYTESISYLLGFVGNHIGSVAVYHLLMQIAWLLLYFFGVRYSFGKTAGYVAGSILAVSPWLLQTMFMVTPENFLMFFFSLLLFALGVLYKNMKKCDGNIVGGWKVYLLLLGFFVGVICTWNYIGWLLVLLIICLLTPALARLLLATGGILLGILVSTIKYIELTGVPLAEQFSWILTQFKKFPGRCLDISPLLLFWVIFSLVAGMIGKCLEKAVLKKRLVKETLNANESIKMEENMITTEEGKKIKLLDNPLPVPKKHVKREMDFKINTIEELTENGIVKDDFDHAIKENDDFDV